MANISLYHQFANIFLTCQTFVTNLDLLRVEVRCKLQEKLHRVTGRLLSFATKITAGPILLKEQSCHKLFADLLCFVSESLIKNY